jgi:hypothetical protein
MEKNNEEVQKKVEVVFSDGSDLWTVLIDGELHYSSATVALNMAGAIKPYQRKF